MKIKEIILKSLAIILFIGGILRVLAAQAIFHSMNVDDFWVEDDFYKFVNKIMGAFFILCAFIFWSVAKDIVRFRFVLKPFGQGIFVFGFIIAVFGYLMDLPVWSWAPDAIVITATSLFCTYIKSS